MGGREGGLRGRKGDDRLYSWSLKIGDRRCISDFPSPSRLVFRSVNSSRSSHVAVGWECLEIMDISGVRRCRHHQVVLCNVSPLPIGSYASLSRELLRLSIWGKDEFIEGYEPLFW